MGLMQHQTPRIVVPLLKDNSVAVRGLSLDDLSALLVDHTEPLSKIAESYAQHKRSVFSSKSFQEYVIAMCKDFPNLASEVISRAADEPEAKDVKLGLGLQIACITAIVKLTLEDAGGLGNLFAQIRSIATRAILAAEAGDEKGSRSKNSTGRGGSR